MRLEYRLFKSLSQSEKGFDNIIQEINLTFEIDFKDKIELKGEFLCQR